MNTEIKIYKIYFFKVLLFKKIRKIPNKKSKKSILLADKIIAKIVIKNKEVRINIFILRSVIFVKKANEKNKKNENLCLKPPAIASV